MITSKELSMKYVDGDLTESSIEESRYNALTKNPKFPLNMIRVTQVPFNKWASGFGPNRREMMDWKDLLDRV